MKKYQLKNKKCVSYLKLFIAKQKREDTTNSLVSSTVFFDKQDNVLVLNLFKLNKENHLVNYIFELVKVSSYENFFYENQISCCEILSTENCNDSRIYINFIGTCHEKYLSQGYNYIMLRSLEQFAIEHNVKKLYGLFLPLPPGNYYLAKNFYSRNKFSFYTNEFDEDMIQKSAKDFRKLHFTKFNGLKIAEDLFEEETETENIEK